MCDSGGFQVHSSVLNGWVMLRNVSINIDCVSYSAIIKDEVEK